MLEFYRLSEELRIAASLLSMLAVIMFLIAALICAVRRFSVPRLLRFAEALALILMSLHALTLVGLVAKMQLGMGTGLLLPSGSVAVRYLLLGLTAPIAAYLAARLGSRITLTLLLPIILTLPVAERLSGGFFPALFFLALSIDIFSSGLVIARTLRRMEDEISGASVKQAIDALHTGIVFCEPNGYILLANKRMQRLMMQLTGEPQRNGERFYRLISTGPCPTGCQRIEIEGETACRMPDGRVWLFSKSDIAVGGTEYTELAATDITERWRMTEELSEQRSALLARGDELKSAIAGLQEQCREEESLRLKEDYHNRLGHRIVLLLRALREGREPDESLLDSLALDLITSCEPGEKKARYRLDSLKTALGGIGVSLSIEGALPPGDELSMLVVDIVTEGSTNAVRHGFATEVDARLDNSGGLYSITIEDNGIPPRGELREGGGLSGLRRRVLEFGGALSIVTSPGFVLDVKIPTGETV